MFALWNDRGGPIVIGFDIALSREVLKLTLADLKAHRPKVKVSEAWVYKTGRDQWEFMAKEGIEGYARD